MIILFDVSFGKSCCFVIENVKRIMFFGLIVFKGCIFRLICCFRGVIVVIVYFLLWLMERFGIFIIVDNSG